jgi:hypothetical protein
MIDFSPTTAIEVTFDNADVVRLLNANRDIRPFFQANHRLFLRAMFDRFASSPTGELTTFTPTEHYIN